MRPTREGKRFILATFLIAVAAVNTGNNLIYLVLAMMLSIVAISIGALHINLNGISVSITAAHPIFVKTGSRLRISIYNKKRFAPSYSIRLLFPENIVGSCLIPHVPAAGSAAFDFDATFKKRGIYKYGAFYIESTFPFILFEKKAYPIIEGEVTVYPEIKEIGDTIPELSTYELHSYVLKQDFGDEFLRIREFVYGDSMRRIQWKATAKTGKLMIMESGISEPKLFTVILDNIKPHDKESFEKAVTFAASIADKFIKMGYLVRLLTCKKTIPFGSESEHFFKILDLLAVIEEEDRWECPLISEFQGTGVLILKSFDSSLKKAAAECSMVIYASDL